MDMFMQRTERLEQDNAQRTLELAVLNARSATFATKSDLAELRTEMHQGFNQLRGEMHQEHSQLRGEMQQGMGEIRKEVGDVRKELGDVRKEVGDLRKEVGGIHQQVGGLYKQMTSQTQWVIGTIIGIAALCMTAAKLLF
ncbi:hypothetical protein [Erwinia sp. Leaf53]|uniref:hypothetical protein n=1 Tax=Erwinia sp. Leaf53 TaxID=1736225 RepID=UPI0006F5C5AE|nr:hypothetical protein [Erwinia sp. Leaf53]KQN56815.1 hypothetical protein ASF13_06790 [Erwinia sp. Leaf53]